jgi:hypothetical protein
MYLWFVPGCPLSLLAVDPQNNYPWKKLCMYKALKDEPQCNYIIV